MMTPVVSGKERLGVGCEEGSEEGDWGRDDRQALIEACRRWGVRRRYVAKVLRILGIENGRSLSSIFGYCPTLVDGEVSNGKIKSRPIWISFVGQKVISLSACIEKNNCE